MKISPCEIQIIPMQIFLGEDDQHSKIYKKFEQLWQNF